jgi:hypothetical protein
MGRKSDAEKILEELKRRSEKSYVPPCNFAELYLGLGEKDQALASQEKAYADRSLTLIANTVADPEFESLQSEPRYKTLMSKVDPH